MAIFEKFISLIARAGKVWRNAYFNWKIRGGCSRWEPLNGKRGETAPSLPFWPLLQFYAPKSISLVVSNRLKHVLLGRRHH